KSRMATSLTAGAALAALLLAGCADNGDAGGPGGGGDGALAGKEITIGVFGGWEEGIAASFLWGAVLEDEGAKVTYHFAEPGPIYAGVAEGQLDIAFDAWLPTTHE